MAELSADGDERDDTHFWVFCPGCAYEGKIGVPHDHPADVVVCPSCHQVVNIRPDDRVLWRPAEANEFLRARFPHVDWDNIEREPRPAPVSDDSPAAVRDQPDAPPEESPDASGNQPVAVPGQPALVVTDKPMPIAERYRAQSGGSTAAWACAVVGVAATLMTLVTAVAHRPPRGWERRDRRVAVRNVDSRDMVDRDAAVNVNPLPPRRPPIQLPPPRNPATKNSPAKSPASESPAPQKPPSRVAAPPAAPPELAWRELYERARQRVKDGDYAQAVEDLNEVLRLNPNFIDALVQRMTAYFQLRRYDEALADVNRQIRLSPDSYWAFVSRAVVNEAIGNWRQVVADLDRAVRLAEADADVGDQNQARAALNRSQKIVKDIYNHARKLFEEHTYAEAAELFTVLLRHRADTAWLVFWRAACYESMGALDRALLDYDHALALGSPPAWAYVRRSAVHERRGDFGAAVLDLRKAVQLEPKNRDYVERLKRMERKRRYHPRAYPARTRIYPVGMRT